MDTLSLDRQSIHALTYLEQLKSHTCDYLSVHYLILFIPKKTFIKYEFLSNPAVRICT